MLELNKIHNLDALTGLKLIPDKSVQLSISSPPYWALRSYLPNEDPLKKYELGQEPKFKDYIENLLLIYKEVYRVLADDGCCFVNLGDTYYGGNKGQGGMNFKQPTNLGSVFMDGKKFNNKELKDKSLCNIPYRFAIKMTDELGWIQRNIIIWHKKNKFPESCKDRFTTDFEPILFFTKNKKYKFKQILEPYSVNSNPKEVYTGSGQKDYLSASAQNPSDSKRRILESMAKNGGRNKRCVWSINVKPTKFKHTATYPLELVNLLIKSGCPEKGIILDPFSGVGSSWVEAVNQGKDFIGFELNNESIQEAEKRIERLKIL